MWIVLGLGFSSGLPLALTAGTLQAWMSNVGINLSTIGLFSLVQLPYAFKFLWSPLLDRFQPPFLGRRKGWILITQMILILAIGVMGFTEPKAHMGLMAQLAVIVAFASASQDIVIDAYRTDVLTEAERGPGSGIFITGYRVGYLCSGSLALIIADHLPWNAVYLAMAGVLAVGVLSNLLAPAPTQVPAPRSLRDAIVLPFVDFFKRKGAFVVVLFVIIYKIDVVMATALTTPFMLSLGFTKTDIGAVTKGVGLIATILGSLLGGAWMVKLGMKKSLIYFGLAQGVSNLTFMVLAHVGHSYPVMVASIGLENFCSGMGTAAFFAFLMSLCNPVFTATQYALLSSLMALTRVTAGAPTGFLVEKLGWETFFLVCTLTAIPGLLLLRQFDRWQSPRVEKI